jgi:uncharacterized protein involved in exopolysaccharide biosynthesis
MRARRAGMTGIGSMVWRRKLLILTCVVLVLGLTAAYVSTLVPAYEAQALVAVDRLGDDASASDAAAEDPLSLIGSRALAERLVERLDLQLVPELHPDHAGGLRLTDLLLGAARWLPNALIERLPQAWADRLAPVEGQITDAERAARLRKAVADATMARTRAETTAPGVISLKFIAENPQLAAAGANALADLYLEERRARRQNARQGDPQMLAQEIERLRTSIRDTEQEIAAARGGAGAQAGVTSEQSRLDLTGELAFWRRERAEVEVRLRQAQAALEPGADLARTPPALDSEQLGQLQARAAELRQALVTRSQQYGEQDPQIAELRAQLAALEQEERAETGQAVQRLQDEVEIIRSRETALEGQLATLEGQSKEGQSADGLTALEQRLDADRALLGERLDQAAAQLQGQPAAPPADARIITPAAVPDRPTYPRLALIWGIATAGALLFGALLAGALEALHGARV